MIPQAQTQLKKISQRLTIAENEYNNKTFDIQLLSQELNQEKSRLSQLNSQLTQAKNEYQTLQNELQSTNSLLSDARLELTIAKNTKISTESDLNKGQQDLSNAIFVKNSSQGAFDVANQSYQAFYKSNLEPLQLQLDQKNLAIAENNKSVASLNSLSVLLKKLGTELVTLLDSQAKINVKKLDLESKVAVLTPQKVGLENNISSAQSTITQLTAAIETLRKDHTALLNEVQRLEQVSNQTLKTLSLQK